MTEMTETARLSVQRLVENWDWPDPAILEDIIALGEESVPALIENLTPEMLADAQSDDAANSIVYYSVELLGELKQPAAIPTLAGLYPQIGEDDDDLLEAVSDALYKLGRTAITPLLSVVADTSLPRITECRPVTWQPIWRVEMCCGGRRLPPSCARCWLSTWRFREHWMKTAA